MMNKFITDIPKRYVIVLMVFFGYINVNYLRTNLSMAVVAMTSLRQMTFENGSQYCTKPEFDWNSKETAVILSSFNYGHILGPVGGVLTVKFGGSTIYESAIALMAIVTLASPFLLKIHYVLFFMANVLIGLSESFIFSSTSQLWCRWAPPNERSKFISFSLIGAFGGPIASFLVAGFILERWNWSMLYYFSGFVTAIWFWIWFFVVNNDPDQDKHISEAERNYIKEKIQQTPSNELDYPWSKILTCVPLLVGCLVKFSLGCGSAFATEYLPQFVKDLSNLDIANVGYISTIPMICVVTSLPLCGCLGDYIRKNNYLSLTNVHKLHMSISLFTGTIIFIVIGCWPNFTASIVCLSILFFFLGFATIDIQLLVLDLAPQYAGLLNSFTNIFYTSAAVITPTIVSFVVTNRSRFQWNTCFLIFGAIYFFSATLFLKFGSGDLQSWAICPRKERNQKSEEN